MQDKRNFQGGLNRDDDARVMPDGDYFYAQNIRILSSEDNTTMLVENVRGTTSETYSEATLGSAREYKVIGSYEDKKKECLYYFIWNVQAYHLILEYNINTDTISTVYRDAGEEINNVLRFDKNTLITGINKIDDLLYWTCDNTYIDNKGELRNNEPKYINVEKAKTGWSAYYANGNYNANPRTAFPIETSYPFEFFAAADGSTYSLVDFEHKLKYIDVCKYKPPPPIYKNQTPIRNVSTSPYTPIGPVGPIILQQTMQYGPEIPANGISYSNIPLSLVESRDELEFAYKKNNLYGHVWQFAYRYIYKNNEQGAYSEWSWVLPPPQYGTNMVDEGKQNLYNEIRVWYHNGPADVEKIEIVARKCSYIETSPDEGNKGEFYLIATVDNYYYDSTWSETTDTSDTGGLYYGYTSMQNANTPYINTYNTDGSSTQHQDQPTGYIDFRNDGVYSQVDPVAFGKLFDQVPLRAKAQEIIGKNRLAYGNYIDGFDQVKPHFELMPEYGNEVQFTIINPTSDDSDTNWYTLGGSSFDAGIIQEYDLTEENFGGSTKLGADSINAHPNWNGWMYLPDHPEMTYDSQAQPREALAIDARAFQLQSIITFPTVAQFGQKFRIRVGQKLRYKQDCKGAWWPNYFSDGFLDYKYFGYQIDLEKTVGGGGIPALIDEFIEDIKIICNYDQVANPPTIPDYRGTEETNPYWGEPIRPYWRGSDSCDSDCTPNYGDWDAPLQTSAEMHLKTIEKVDSDFGNDNVIRMFWHPFGQTISESTGYPNGDCSQNYPIIYYRRCTGEETTNLHVMKSSNGTYRDFTECGSCNCSSGYRTFDCNDFACQPCDFCCRAKAWDDTERYMPSAPEWHSKFTYSPALEQGTIWEDSNNTNDTLENNIKIVDDASTFKSGAWHRFGLVYYDEKGRSSTVMLNEPTPAAPDRNSSVYVAFPTERKYKQFLDEDGSFNYTNNALSNAEKLQPADIAWKIYHKPPVWARYYHWVYARNSSVGEFLQFMIDAAYVNKGAKAGTSQGEATADSKIYISLNTMDGRDWSYGNRNRSLVGKWSFAEGDRIRILTDSNGTVMTNPDTDVQTYYDFKISEVGHYPGRFDYDPNAPEDMEDGRSGKVKLSPDSPAGGELNQPAKAKPGKFIILDDPKVPGYNIDSEVNGEITKWAGVRVEIYRPKKNTNEEESLYYEFSERHAIVEPGTEARRHAGGAGGQAQQPDADYIAGDNVDSDVPATGRFRRGDVWYKSRDLSTAAVTVPGQFFEDYFLNDFMQTNHNNIGRPHISSPYAKAKRREATITYSDVYTLDTQFNGLHSFNFSQRPYMDYDITKGSIQKLVATETNLVMMQENKCSTLMISKNIINSPDGDAGLTLSTNILPEEQTYTSGDFGPCLNPESVAVHEQTIYFIDIRRGAAIRIGGDGITVISDYKMKDFFRDKMDLYENILESQYDDLLDGGLFILGGYDRRHGEYVVTFPNVYSNTVGTTDEELAVWTTSDRDFDTNSLREDGVTALNLNTDVLRDNVRDAIYDEDVPIMIRDGGRRVTIANKAETIAFNEGANKWTSFYTFYPDYYATLNRIFISFKNGILYKHDSDATNHTMFYDNPYPDESIIEFPFNGDVSSVKTWNNLTLEGADKQEVIPLVNTSTNGGNASVVATTGSANIEATNINFQANDIAVGDSLWYNDNGTLRTLGVITAITDADTIVTSVGEVNAFIAASSTSSGNALFDVFVITADTTMYKAKFETNINSSEVTHRTSYENTATNAGTWVTREEVASTHIPFGNTNTSGGEYFGIGSCTCADDSTTLTGASFLSAGLQSGDIIYYDNSGTETIIGTIDSITDTVITLTGNASASLTNTFMFVVKNASIDGDRLKGHYMWTRLTKRTKDKVHLFAANANVINSELTNK